MASRSTWFKPAALLLASLALLSCSAPAGNPGSATGQPDAPAVAELLLEGLLPLPPAGWAPPPHRASLDYVQQRSGSETYRVSAAAQDNGDGSLSLAGETDALLFAVYRFEGLLPSDEISLLSAELFDLQAGGGYYLALADYSQGRWVLHPFTPEDTVDNFIVPLDAGATLLSTDGSLYAAVLCPAGLSARINSLRLFIGRALQPPAELSASFGTAWDAVALDWADVPQALAYDIYFKPSEQGEEMYELLSTVAAGTSSFSHSRSAPEGKEAEYNRVYDYRIQSRAGIETSAGFSPVASGGRFFSDVLSLSATDRSEVGGVMLQWEAAAQPGLEGISYEIYRSGVLQGTTSQTLALVGSDPNPDAGVYEFWVVPITPDGFGAESQHDFGSELCFEHYKLVSEQAGCLGLAGAMVAGTPALAWHETSPVALRFLRAANAAPAAPEDWLGSELSLPPDVSVTGPLQLLDWQGRPLLISHVIDSDTVVDDITGVWLSLADTASPQSPADWQSVLIGYDPDMQGSPRGAVIGGRLSLVWVTESGGSYNAFYFRSGADPLVKLDYIADFLVDANVGMPFELDIAEIDGHPALLFAGGTHLRYFSTTELGGAGPEDWTSHDISNSFAPFHSPRLLQWNQRICGCVVNGSGPDRKVATTLLTWPAAGLNPQLFSDWLSAGTFAPPGRKHICTELRIHPQDYPVSMRYGSESGDDIGSADEGPGVLFSWVVSDGENTEFQSHSLRELALGLGEGAFFIPHPPAPTVLEDLRIAQFEHGGDTGFALALNPEDDGAGMELRYFYVPSGTP